MNLYSKKQRWKIILVLIAAVIVGISLWFTGDIVGKIKESEKRKVEQWASDVKSNIEQVNITDSLLLQQQVANELLIEHEERAVRDWADAMQELSKDYSDYSFFIRKIQSNNNIPLIILNHKGEPSDVRNLPFTDKDMDKQVYNDSLKALCAIWGQERPAIELDYIMGQKFKVFYSKSKAIEEFERNANKYREQSEMLLSGFNERLKKSIKQFPVVYVDAETEEVIATNVPEKLRNSPEKLHAKIKEMEEEHGSIPVVLGEKTVGYIYYQNSDLVTLLSYYPYIQFGIIGLFLLVSYFLFSTFRKAEQNQVWVGMAKETAHQLGTPISSLMAWTELLKSQGVDETAIEEINKDLARLNTVTDRFSKIGSGGELQATSLNPIVERVYAYLEKRVSKKVEISIEGDEQMAMINEPLLEWVIENLSKNAIDAMEGKGKLTACISSSDKEVYLDIKDTGKGIPGSKFKTVFEPGYTTKKRGWGLGLSLVKRIIESYHKGKVYVLESELDKGTTFRVVLKKA